MLDDDLRRAIALSKSGKNMEARKIFEEIVQADLAVDIAWIWLANTYVENKDRIAILEKWLNSNPKSQNAKNWVAAYKNKKWRGQKPPGKTPATQKKQVANYQGNGDIPTLIRRSDQVRNRRKRHKRPSLVPAFTVGLLVLAGLAFLVVRLIQGQGFHPSLIAILPSAPVPTLFTTSTRTPGLPSTPTATLTASSSSTPRPAFTDTPLPNTATVRNDLTYLYAGPSANHPIIKCQGGDCIYNQGAQVTLVAKHSVYANTWFLVIMPDGKSGWLYADWLLINAGQETVPTASVYPTYPASSTP
jgi:hypothetical protein